MILERLSSISFTGWLLFLLLFIFFVIAGNVLTASRAQNIFKRIQDMNIFSSGTEEEKLMRKPLHQRLYMMLEKRISVFVEKNVERGKYAPLETKLIQANDYTTKPTQHWAKKIIICMVFSVLGLILGNPVLMLLFGFLGFLLPDSMLNDKIKKRQYKIKKTVPDFLDLLAATAPSAKNLEDAIRKVAERSEGEITDEFKLALNEINSGARRRDALTQMARRCGVLEIDSLVSQINQSENFGTPIQKTLDSQAEKLRKMKKLLIETKAQKASVTLLLPSLFLLGTCLIIIVGPSVVQLMGASGMM
ncbi:hypothetical protein CN918_27290 [Priestia megaterium]|nr:hypothetical protein CN918_27290 [Priestia megaterium]